MGPRKAAGVRDRENDCRVTFTGLFLTRRNSFKHAACSCSKMTTATNDGCPGRDRFVLMNQNPELVQISGSCSISCRLCSARVFKTSILCNTERSAGSPMEYFTFADIHKSAFINGTAVICLQNWPAGPPAAVKTCLIYSSRISHRWSLRREESFVTCLLVSFNC